MREATRDEQFEERLKTSPIAVTVGIPPDFADYGGGIEDGLFCKEQRAHLMIIVGHGIESGQEFWLMRNSHGTWWGEEGYWRLSKKAKSCLLDKGVGSYIEVPETKYGTIFGSGSNPHYQSSHVAKRYQEIMQNKTIKEHPVFGKYNRKSLL